MIHRKGAKGTEIRNLGLDSDGKPERCRVQWYDQRQLGLGEKFLREIDQTVGRILENPFAFPVIRRRHKVRRAMIQRFPYRIFISLTDDTVVVHAVLHGHQEDRHWEDRL
jgi:hypothetical protein